jgi:hypothetical protein|tara:strand:- start:2065 stop:2403 length:339 start_codon:yes stop_codon:yes gene_type:complete
MIWNALIGLATTVVTGKQRITEAKVTAKEKQMAATDNWELEAMKASGESWKDELWTVLFVIIIAACFVPGMQPYVVGGFLALEQTPTWFQVAIGMSVSASFGIKAYSLFNNK